MCLYRSLSSLALSVAWGAMVFGTANLAAQSRRRLQATKALPVVKVDTQALSDSLECQYKDYRFVDARKTYEELSQALSLDTVPVLLQRGEQLQRAERMLTRIEALDLLASRECTWGELGELFATYVSKDIAAQLRFGVDSLGVYQMEQVVNVDGYRWRLVSEGSPYNLVRRERMFEGEDVFDLGESVNRKDADEAFGFILSDGIRLIFASNQKQDGLGGYDLYFSRYNIERKAYLEPTLVPMPFNSPSNDYLLVCDEEMGRTYLVSDRDASEGKVRLFVFAGVPQFISGVRNEDVPIDNENYEKSITQARLVVSQDITTLTPAAVPQHQEQCFLPLNGDVVIRQWSEFTSAEAMDMYRLYLAEEKKLKNMERTHLEPNAIVDLREQQQKRLVAVKNIEIKNRMK